jgi:drug/metabolite transporter (DMT)-like permease
MHALHPARTLRSSWIPSACFFLLTPLLMAANLLVVRAIEGEAAPLATAFGRWAVAGLFLSAIAWLHDRRPRVAPDPGDRRTLALLALFGGAGTVGPQYVAAHFTTAGMIATAFAAAPAFTLLIARLVWRRRMSSRSVAGCALSIAGVALLTGGGIESATLYEGTNPVGNGALMVGLPLAVAGAACWATYTALLQHRAPAVSQMALLHTVAWGGAGFLLPAAIAEASIHPAMPTTRALLLIAALGLVAGVAVYWCYGRLVASLGATPASATILLTPLFAALGDRIIWKEPISPFGILGMTAITAGVILIVFQKRAEPAGVCPQAG